METTSVISQWHFDFFVMILIIGLIYFHYLATGFRTKESNLYFFLAIMLFLLAESSPLHFLGMHYYFSAHMISHILLLLICGPLLVFSFRPKPGSFFYKKSENLSSFLYKYSWLAWFAGVGIMWFWHIPAVFDASFLHMQGFSIVPVLHAGSMLVAGMLFSWPLFGPFVKYHIHPLSGVIYLFTACITCSLLGLLITFAPLGSYHHYLSLSGMNMGNSNPWNLSAEEDQQAAGLIMWVPCCFIYLSGCIYLLQQWFAGSNITKGKIIKLNTPATYHE